MQDLGLRYYQPRPKENVNKFNVKIIIMKRILIFALAIMFLSCSKDHKDTLTNTDNNSSNIPSIFKDAELDYTHSVTIHRELIDDERMDYLILGQFYDGGNLTSSSTLFVNGRQISQNSENEYVEYTPNSSASFLSLFSESDGVNVEIDYTVSTVSDSVEIYSPTDIIFTTDQSLNALDKNSSLTIEWNSDGTNDFEDIGIAIISRGVNGDITSETKDLHYTIVTTDDGIETIPASAYSSWPDNLWFDVVLTRGNQVLSESSETLITTFVTNLHTGKITE